MFNLPPLHVKSNTVFANSRDVASFFGRRLSVFIKPHGVTFSVNLKFPKVTVKPLECGLNGVVQSFKSHGKMNIHHASWSRIEIGKCN